MSQTLTATKLAQFGVIGLGVMGQNLALNLADHGQRVAVWNLEPEWVARFLSAHEGQPLSGSPDLAEFVHSLERPRRMLMMIKAGEPVDEMLDRLAPLLESGDIVIDGGNSYFRDTERREARMKQLGLHFFGMGVSGGEEGARRGPSLMPGGDEGAYETMRETLEAIAAHTDSGPCVTYVGAGGAGHFVKMVHNGIEYGDMQLIAEAYDLLHRALGLDADAVAEVFDRWNRGPLASYLIEITAEVLSVRDPETHRPLVEMILDKAGQKGTGRWTVQTALDLGIPIPTIAAALDARALSSFKSERVALARQFGRNGLHYQGEQGQFIADIHDALLASKICSYAQGMSLIAAGAAEWQWKIRLREMARIWKGGCIIRASLLDPILEAYDADPSLVNLLHAPALAAKVADAAAGWRRVVAQAAQLGLPTPAFAASLAWFDALTSAQLPQNLTQAQRDFFGAHTYQRADRPEAPPVHTDWQQLLQERAR